MASVGEYGLDINNGAIADPSTFEDFMSYCNPRWISKFTYDFLTNIAQLSPVVVPSGAAGAPRIIEDRSPGFEPDTRKSHPSSTSWGRSAPMAQRRIALRARHPLPAW
jgi:hypothetical protein